MELDRVLELWDLHCVLEGHQLDDITEVVDEGLSCLRSRKENATKT
jgi:hypothetical protein